jgi:GNAT superfamily N-acetyltransferase
MRIRLIEQTDVLAVRLLAREASGENEAGLGFDDLAFAESFSKCFNGDLTCFVCETEHGALIGFLLARIDGFRFAAGLSTCCEVVYVTPAKRGSRAPALLIDEFFRWSEIVGARRKYLGINNALHPDRTARFFERYGARRVGVYLAAD